MIAPIKYATFVTAPTGANLATFEADVLIKAATAETVTGRSLSLTGTPSSTFDQTGADYVLGTDSSVLAPGSYKLAVSADSKTISLTSTDGVTTYASATSASAFLQDEHPTLLSTSTNLPVLKLGNLALDAAASETQAISISSKRLKGNDTDKMTINLSNALPFAGTPATFAIEITGKY
ncbi:MAG TPA: hypothetical protein DD435_06340 [Cyanobacteria bacterium UBA8530]|nr:hypothetical protein [Cyanobacteria bacterium UBA8530]